jgi:hypothetical protein
MNDVERRNAMSNEQQTPGLPDDWKPPGRALLEKAWDEHPRRDELDALKRERDQDGNPTWNLHLEDDADDPNWAAYWLRPADPRNDARSIRVVRYPKVYVERREADARAIVDEHWPYEF